MLFKARGGNCDPLGNLLAVEKSVVSSNINELGSSCYNSQFLFAFRDDGYQTVE